MWLLLTLFCRRVYTYTHTINLRPYIVDKFRWVFSETENH